MGFFAAYSRFSHLWQRGLLCLLLMCAGAMTWGKTYVAYNNTLYRRLDVETASKEMAAEIATAVTANPTILSDASLYETMSISFNDTASFSDTAVFIVPSGVNVTLGNGWSNSGLIIVFGTLRTTSTFKNLEGGEIIAKKGSSLISQNNMVNNGTFSTENGSTFSSDGFTNSATGTFSGYGTTNFTNSVSNAGTIDNYGELTSSSTIENSGTINNYGTITGNINNQANAIVMNYDGIITGSVTGVPVAASGNKYYWQGSGHGGDGSSWTDGRNWRDASGSTFVQSNYPGSRSSAEVHFPDTATVQVSISVTIDQLILNGSSSLVLDGGGLLTTRMFDWDKVNVQNATIRDGSTLVIQETLYANGGSGRLNFINDGRLVVPKTGANVDYGSSFDGSGNPYITYSNKSAVQQYEGTDYAPWYNVAVDSSGAASSYTEYELPSSFPSDGLKMTVGMKIKHGNSPIQFPYKITFNQPGTAAYKLDGGDVTSAAEIEGNLVLNQASSITSDHTFVISAANFLAQGDGFTIIIYTPDKEWEMAKISYTQAPYAWTGALDRIWNKAGNWNFIPAGFTNFETGLSATDLIVTTVAGNNYPQLAMASAVHSMAITGNASLEVTSAGSLTAGAISSENGNNATIINNGTIAVTAAIATEGDKISSLTNAGTLTASSVNAQSLTNYATITASAGITANSLFSNNLIQTASLTADDFKAGTSDSRAGTLEISGSGGTLRINNPAEPYSWLNNLVIDDGASLTLYEGVAGKNLSVYGDWINSNASGGLTANDYTITFKGTGKSVSGNQTFATVAFSADTTISGNNTFTAFSAEVPGTNLTFGAGKTQTISSLFRLTGASGNPISLKSSIPGTAWNISAPATTEATSTVQYVDVSDSHAANPFITAKSTAAAPANDNRDGGNNVNWDFVNYIYTWTGNADTSPANSANWEPQSIPSSSSFVLIPDGKSRYPEAIAPITYSVRSLTVGTEGTSPHTASIRLGGGVNFTTGSLTNYGTVTLSGAASFTLTSAFANYGSMVLNGTETVSMPSGNITEAGTWHYAGTGSGKVKEITNLSYNKLLLTGTLGVADGYQVRAANGIQFGSATETLNIQGDARFASPISLSNSTEIGGAAGYVISFGDSLDGNADLTLKGGYVRFGKDVGKTSPLASLTCTINGTDLAGDPEFALTLCGVSVTTTGDQSYTGYVALYGTDNTDKTSTGDSSLESSAGKISFSYKIFSDGRDGAESHGLTVSARDSVTFGNSVGDRTSNPLSFLSVSSSAIAVTNVVKTSGSQSYTGTVTSSGVITGSAAPLAVLTFNGPVINNGTIAGGAGSVTFANSVQNSGNIALAGGNAVFTGAYSGLNGILTASSGTTTFLADAYLYTTTFNANGGTVIFSGDSASIDGNSMTGTSFATVICKGSGITLTGNNSFESAVINADITFNGNNTFGTFLAETGGTMLTLEAGSRQTVTGLTPAALKLTGTESERISLAGSGTFVVAKTGFSGEYLSVGNDVKIAEVAGSVVPGAFPTTNSTIASGAVLSNVLNNGWKFTSLAFEWEGDVDGNWDNAANWNVGLIPGTENFTDSTVTISAGKTNYPQVTATSYTLQSLTIGSDLAPEASLAFSGTGNINVSGTFTNHGRVHYQNSGRIRDGSSAPLNDTANNGWVEYDGSVSLTDFAPASDADYANLRVSAAVSLGGDIVVSGRFENTASGTVDGNSGLYVGGEALVEGALGSLVQLSAFSVSGLATVGADISTSGSQLYGDDLTLSSGAAFTSSASSLTFSGPVNSSSSPKDNLTLQAVDVTFSDTVSVGQVTAHAAVTVAEGAFVHASDQQRYDGKVTNKGRISGENLITFEGEVLNTGTIAVPALADGVVALIFAGQYEGSAGTLTGAQTTDEDKSPNPVIECRGNVSLGTFTHNDDSLLFSGISLQTLVTNGQAVKDISFANAAGVSISDDVTVTGNWSNTGICTAATATFTGEGKTVSGNNTFATAVFNADTSLSGSNTFAVFSVSRKDTVLSFGAGTNQTVTDLFFVQGEEDHLVTLKSTLAGSVWHINVPVDKADVSYALVSDSVSAFEEIQARLSVNGGNNTFWDFMEGLPLPSLRMMLSPVGDNRIYALFSGKIYYKGVSLGNLSGPEYDEAVPLVIQNIYFITAGGNPATDSSCIQTDWQINRMDFVAEDDGYTLLYLHLSKNISLEDLSGMSVYIKLLQAPSVKHFHALSDFALNVVQPVYARTEEAASSTVRDFTADSQDRLRAESDITLQVQLIGGRDGQGKSQPVKNGEKALLIPDLKADIKSTWKSNVVNSLLGTDWRVWLTAALESLATSYNDAPQKSAEGKPVEDSGGLLYNYTLINAADKASQTDYYGWKAKDEVQFIFKMQDSSGNDILVDIDGDGSRKIPLYALSMPKVSAKAMPLLDLWSFRFKDVQKQRGGVTIMNNVIDVNQREQTVIQVDMAEAGFLNVYVMTLDGNIVQQLEHGHISAGSHYYRWDGSNTGGSSVARGLYFVRVVGSGIDETRKVLCVKD